MWGVALLTLGLPWVVVPGVENPYLEPKALLLTAGGWGLILWHHFRLPMVSTGWRNPWTVWLIGWVVGVSCWKFQWHYLYRSPGQSELIFNWYVWSACGMVVMAVLLAHSLATAYFRHPFSIQRVTQWMCVSAGLAACYGLGQWLGLDQWYVQTNAALQPAVVMAGFGNAGYLGIYLALLLPLFLLFSSKRYFVGALLAIVALWLTQARYAWVAAVGGVTASLLARWWLRMKRWQRVGAMSLLGVGLLSLSLKGWPALLADETRWPLWMAALDKLRSTIWKGVPSMTGYGLESFPILMGDAHHWAHNEWVQMLVEIGVVGTVLLAGMVAWSTWRGWQAATRSLLVSGWFGTWVAFLVISLFHFPGHLAPLAWVGLCAWAVMEQPELEGVL